MLPKGARAWCRRMDEASDFARETSAAGDRLPPAPAPMPAERGLRRILFAIALIGIAEGLFARAAGSHALADLLLTLTILPIAAALLISSVRAIVRGRFGVDVIAFLAMAGAVALGQPLAGAVVALMYSGGALLEDIAVARAERNLRWLADRAPRIAHRHAGDAIEDVPVAQVHVGDRLLVRAGEVVPVDGTVSAGLATIDESSLTGEPIPVTRAEGASVASGTINAGQTFELRATAPAGESTYAGIVRLVTAAQAAKAPFVRMADRFALGLLPATLLLALGAWLISHDPTRSLAVFVAATPCPLILAAPIALIAGLAQAAWHGILVKGGGALEALARAHTVLFDKTGTLTLGGARLLAIETAPGQDAATVLQCAASIEQASHHVIAEVIVKAALDRGLPLAPPDRSVEAAGSGVQGMVAGKRVSAGAADRVLPPGALAPWARHAMRRAEWRSALLVFVAVEGEPIGALLLADALRPDAPRALRRLREAGVARILMVTGDRAASAETIGAALDLDAVLADRLPSDKVDAVRIEQRQYPTVMVGDGINDAPALAAADVGIALGARGATASSEAADVVILTDRLERVGDAILIARRARAIAWQSIVAGMGLSAIAMIAAALGWLAPVPAALIQEAIDVMVIVNALRALRTPASRRHGVISAEAEQDWREAHAALRRSLEQLRDIADALEDAKPEPAGKLIAEANDIVGRDIVTHERGDERVLFPALAKRLRDRAGLAAIDRAHREILHLARQLDRLARDLGAETIDRYLVRDAQRLIETIHQIVRIHTEEEEDFYVSVAAS